MILGVSVYRVLADSEFCSERWRRHKMHESDLDAVSMF